MLFRSVDVWMWMLLSVNQFMRCVCLCVCADDSASATSSMEVTDRLASLEQRVQMQEDEIQLLKSALADVVRRLNTSEEQQNLQTRRGPTKGNTHTHAHIHTQEPGTHTDTHLFLVLFLPFSSLYLPLSLTVSPTELSASWRILHLV